MRCPNCRAKNVFTGAQLRAIANVARQAQKVQKAHERARVAEDRETKKLHAEARQTEVDAMNEALEDQIAELRELLGATLNVDDYIEFETLKEIPATSSFSPGDLIREEPRPRLEDWLPPEPSGIGKLMPGAKTKREQQIQQAQAQFQSALAAHSKREEERNAKLAAAKEKHDAEVQAIEGAVQQQHQEIESLKRRFEEGDPSAVVSYFSQVLEASAYPETFPHHTKMAFVPESKQLVIEFQLPGYDVIPEVKSYKYIKTRDEISETALPATQRKALYTSVIAQVALRTIHEILEADRSKKLETLVFNGYVNTTDKRTGKSVSPYLVTVRTTRDSFEELDLERVEPTECLKGLNASVSRSPSELAPVRPVLEFGMVDPRFVEESDVLSALDQRPNLMELTPGEFESLITNLFEKMGLETRMTQASRDGGVDCVAWDQRPIFGGKVVIQAKRYKNTVGVSAVRDLFGTVQNEGASKGILVTTSGYGKAAFDFAGGKPLELLDGGNLLYLLKEHAEIDARIEVPEDWVDASPEM